MLLGVWGLNPVLAEAASGAGSSNVGIGLALLGGALQIILGLGLAVTSIVIGLRIMGRVLPDIKITDELLKKNKAVGLMSAGVVIAYTKVISTGISQIGESISVGANIGSFIGAVVNVLIGVGLASVGVTWAFKALDKVATEIDLAKEIKEDNVACGLFVAGVLFGISEMIAAAVAGIGQAIASALSRMF
ncbi:MAG: DUF350 domain-containing protein [Planctomycetes bacterium]|nr:DUF350 domain-containing protein [Planctomycetota bacterium]